MTGLQLEAVRAASQRERAHSTGNRFAGAVVACYCGTCKTDREVIAAALPDLLRYIDDAMLEPRREHFDLGDLD